MDRQFKKEVQDACHFLRESGRKCLDDRLAAMALGDEVPEDILTYVVRTKGTGIFKLTRPCRRLLLMVFLIVFSRINL